MFKRKLVLLGLGAVLASVTLASCVETYSEYDEYTYSPAPREVVVHHARPVYRRVDVYREAPRVKIVREIKRPSHHKHRSSRYHRSSSIAPPSSTAKHYVPVKKISKKHSKNIQHFRKRPVSVAPPSTRAKHVKKVGLRKVDKNDVSTSRFVETRSR